MPNDNSTNNSQNLVNELCKHWTSSSALLDAIDKLEQDLDINGLDAIADLTKTLKAFANKQKGRRIRKCVSRASASQGTEPDGAWCICCLQKLRAYHAKRNHFGRTIATAVIGACGVSVLLSLYNNGLLHDLGIPPTWTKPIVGGGLLAALIAYACLSYIFIWDYVLARYEGAIKAIRDAMHRQA